MDAYRRALGMLADTPLGQAAMERAEAATAPTSASDALDKARQHLGGTGKPRKPFAEQPLGPKRGRGRPRRVLFDRDHPEGTA